MQLQPLKPPAILSALAIAAAILLLTGMLADGLRRSELYARSRFVSVLLSQDTMELRELVADRENVETLIQFVGAVTAAYIDFELIPVGEAGTFAAVFQSRPPAVQIDRFAYHGTDLSIFGAAPSEAEYDKFVRLLAETNYFESVSGQHDEAAEGEISFEIKKVSLKV
jgi:hypothetical protein